MSRCEQHFAVGSERADSPVLKPADAMVDYAIRFQRNERSVMPHRLRQWIFSLLLAGMSSVATADDLYIVCHAGVSLAAGDIRDMFLGEKQFLGAVRLVPVDNIAAQPIFLEKVLKMDSIKYAATWAKKSFRDGINPPPAMVNDGAVLEFVKRTPGGCGYLGADPPAGVTVIGKY